MYSEQAVVDEVARLISISLSKSILGSTLAGALKAAFPDFSPFKHSCRNLREFLRIHAPNVSVVGRSGGDVIYGLAGQGMTRTLAADAVLARASIPKERLRRLNTDVWKAFSNPNSRSRLYGDPESGMVKVLGLAEPSPAPPWKTIPSISAENHIRIAKEFVQSLPDQKQQDQLAQTFEQSQWSLRFFDVAFHLGISKQWGAFRGRKILEEFYASLKSLGIPNQVRPVGVGPLEDRPRSRPVHQSLPAPGESTLLRRLAVSAIGKMSDLELRELCLPLGYIVDELKEE